MMPNGKSICLNMIVKNEARVIKRCLAGVRPLIDSWVIVDTGSTDGTQEIIREFLGELPGTLHQRPWVNFGTNRNEALALGRDRADYLLIVDADEVIACDPGFELPALDADGYEILHHAREGGMSFLLTSLVSTAKPWRYEGAMHEVIVCDGDISIARLDGVRITGMFDSARNQVDARIKYLNDAAILEKALAEQPGHPRNTYYLAQSYRDAGELDKAIAWYEQRAELAGWDEEIWSALYEAGRLKWQAGRPVTEVSASLLRAYQARPTRAEPLVLLAMLHRARQEYALAYLYANAAVEIPRPADRLFLAEDVYTWQALDEKAVAASWTGRFREALVLCDKLLHGTALPQSERARVRANRAIFAKECK